MMKSEDTEKVINANEIDINEIHADKFNAIKSANIIDVNQNLETEEQQSNLENAEVESIQAEDTAEDIKKDIEETVTSLRQAGSIQQLFKNNAGIIVLGAGIFFTATNNMIGPYMMGVGAAAVGFSLKEATGSVSSLSITDRNNQQL